MLRFEYSLTMEGYHAALGSTYALAGDRVKAQRHLCLTDDVDAIVSLVSSWSSESSAAEFDMFVTRPILLFWTLHPSLIAQTSQCWKNQDCKKSA